MKDELCREVNESSRPIKSVATECGAGPRRCATDLKKYKEADGGTESDSKTNVSEPARLRELERENQELSESS
ncbi:hypothetical protein DQ353_12135 [Arthrobacter sp. AQ5-05]|nr:hypothetical protein DQ353_12135 [Arthrobacter sp. AQ5-05]